MFFKLSALEVSIFNCNAVLAITYELYTSNIYTYNKYWYRVGAKTYVAFKVKACNDAHVALFDEYMLDLAYEIVLGGSGNTISAIRRTRLQENKVQVILAVFFFGYLAKLLFKMIRRHDGLNGINHNNYNPDF